MLWVVYWIAALDEDVLGRLFYYLLGGIAVLESPPRKKATLLTFLFSCSSSD